MLYFEAEKHSEEIENTYGEIISTLSWWRPWSSVGIAKMVFVFRLWKTKLSSNLIYEKLDKHLNPKAGIIRFQKQACHCTTVSKSREKSTCWKWLPWRVSFNCEFNVAWYNAYGGSIAQLQNLLLIGKKYGPLFPFNKPDLYPYITRLYI